MADSELAASLGASAREVEGIQMIWTKLPPTMDEIIRKVSDLRLRKLQGDVYFVQDIVTKHQVVSQKVIDRSTEGARVMRRIDGFLVESAARYRRLQEGALR